MNTKEIESNTHLSSGGFYNELDDDKVLCNISVEDIRIISIRRYAIYVYFKKHNCRPLRIVRRTPQIE